MHEVLVVARDVDAVLDRELLQALALHVARDDALGIDDLGVEQALDERARHVAGADEPEGQVSHRVVTSC